MDLTPLRPAGPPPRTPCAPRTRAAGHVSPRRVRGAWLALVLLGLGACDSLPTMPGVPGAAPDHGLSFEEAPALSQEATGRINQHRAALGCRPLRWHGAGAALGEQYARLMNDAAFFGHVGPGGSTLRSRLDQAGIVGYRIAAETIAAGQQTATKVVGDWILSPGHRAILEDCQYTHVGIGVYTGGGPYRTYWTAVFLRLP